MKYTYREIWSPEYMQSCGGTFCPENGTIEDVNIDLTDFDLIKRHMDQGVQVRKYLSSWFGGGQDNGFIGNMDPEIRENGKIYYIATMGEVKEIMFVKDELGKMSNLMGIWFIIVDGNRMFDCYLEDGDIVFDSKEEAIKWVENKNI